MTTQFSIKDIIKGNYVKFHFLRANTAYYKIRFSGSDFMFPVPLDDLGEATLLAEDKAIMFMRYIRKAVDNKEFVKAT
jgi:hypothetical protein